MLFFLNFFKLQILRLKQLKIKLEAKMAEQEEELDEQAGTIQQLEQVVKAGFISITVMVSHSSACYGILITVLDSLECYKSPNDMN